MTDRHLLYINCSTYNHSSYIKKTLDGFCMQKTNFPFVCGIIDDASKDGEQEIILQYLNDYFDLDNTKITRKDETEDYTRIFTQHRSNSNCFFVVVLLKYNHYSIKKSRMLYVSEWRNNAKYIAECEGDDYWVKSDKIQKQFDYLESQEKCGLIYTKAKVYSEKEKQFIGCVGEDCNSFSGLLINNTIPTLTIMCRSDVYHSYFDDIKPSSHNWKMGDYPRWLYIAAHNDIHFLDEVTAVYRANEGSASRPQSYQAKLSYLESSKDVRLFFCEKYNCQHLRKQIEAKCDESCVVASIDFGEKKNGIRLIIHSKALSLRQKITLFVKVLKS